MKAVATMPLPGHSHFEERQRFRQVWLWAVLLGIAAVSTAAVLISVRELSWTALFLLTPAALVYLLYRLELDVRVDDRALSIRFTPLVRKSIPLSEIAAVAPRTYRPLLEYGGWGIRYSLSGRGLAYNVSGNRGVQLVLTDGSRILVGSQRPEDLAAAVERARHG